MKKYFYLIIFFLFLVLLPTNSIFASLVSDINNDGIVDGEDLISLAGSFATTSKTGSFNPKADFDKNSRVDGDDLIILGTEFGNRFIEPSINITSPNGEELWKADSTYNITWNSLGSISNVAIELFKGENYHSTIISSASNTGYYSWRIDSSLTVDFDYKIKIYVYGDLSVNDYSDSSFAIIKEVLPSPKTKLVDGSIILPTNSPLIPADLSVWTIAGNTSLNSSGGFTGLESVNEGLSQNVFVKNKSGNVIAVVYLSAEDVASGNLTITSEKMALGLIRMNPYMMFLSADKEKLILDQTRSHVEFLNLVTDIESALIDSPDNALDYESYPYIYNMALRIGIEVIASYSDSTQSGSSQSMRSMRSAYANLSNVVGSVNVPHIKDLSGPEITLVNPKQTFYSVDFQKGNTLMRGRGGGLVNNVGWSLPSEWIKPIDPYEETYDLGDGTFKIIFYKGFNFSEEGWMLIDTIPGKATYANFLKMFGTTMKGVGLIPGLGFVSTFTLSDELIQILLNPNNKNIPSLDFSEIAAAINEGANWKKLYLEVLPYFIKNNYGQISKWVFGVGSKWTNSSNVLDYMNSADKILDGLFKALPWVSAALTINTEAPFIYDIIMAPWKPEYTIRQTNGIVTEISSLIPPTPMFTVDNMNPAVGQTVNFSADSCYDNYDSPESLQVRWDFNNDGIWDINWTNNKNAAYSYTNRGNYRPLLEARDLDGLTARVSHDIVVGSMEALKIVLTWGANPGDIDSHLFTPKIEEYNYQIYYLSRGSLEFPPYAWLDIDDRDGYGPETIWIEKMFSGIYTYSVYKYSGSGAITESSAHVEVIGSQGVIAKFDVPTSGSGLWWNVFTLNGNTGEITGINTISNSGNAFSFANTLMRSSNQWGQMPSKGY